MYGELITTFHGRKVQPEFAGADHWQGPEFAYRISEDWEDENPTLERLQRLLEVPGVDKLECLIIGAWTEAGCGEGPEEIYQLLADNGAKLCGLRHLFLGEMTYEESEVSWINQCDVTPVLDAFPQLESLRIRGGESLSFSSTTHEGLKELAVETGGLSRRTIHEIQRCQFPNLETLELLLGDRGYGFDAEPEDFVPMLAGELFPKLKRLGLMNSEIANDLAALVVNSPIVSKIEVLDHSMGNLDDVGAKSLMNLPESSTIKKIDLTHHYMTTDGIAALKQALPTIEIVCEDSQLEQAEDDWRPILHAE